MEHSYNRYEVRKSPPDIRRYKGIARVSSDNLPKEFELPKCETKDQGSVGSCVAFALAGCVEYFNKRESKKYEEMSTGFIYGNRRNTLYKGSGMNIGRALDSLKHYGTTKSADWDINVETPQAIEEFEKVYDEFASKAYQNRITSYFRLYDKNSIKATLYQGSPCVFFLTFREDMRIKDGVYIINEKSKSTGNHCMYIYGWNEIGWKVANSWGKWFGDDGNIIIPYDAKINDVYGLQDSFDSTKVNADIKHYENKLEELRKERAQIYIKYGAQLSEEAKKMLEDIDKKMEEIELKIQALQSKLVDIEKPFINMQWLAKILNAIIQFLWRLFNKD